MTDIADANASEHPDVVAAARQLVARLSKFKGRAINHRTFDEINILVKDHRRQCRMRGVQFPELAALVLTGVGAIEMVRKDIDLQGLQTHIVNIARKYPAVKPDELARAVKWAFPWYRPGHIDLSACEVKRPVIAAVNGHGQ